VPQAGTSADDDPFDSKSSRISARAAPAILPGLTRACDPPEARAAPVRCGSGRRRCSRSDLSSWRGRRPPSPSAGGEGRHRRLPPPALRHRCRLGLQATFTSSRIRTSSRVPLGDPAPALNVALDPWRLVDLVPRWTWGLLRLLFRLRNSSSTPGRAGTTVIGTSPPLRAPDIPVPPPDLGAVRDDRFAGHGPRRIDGLVKMVLQLGRRTHRSRG